MISLKPVTQDNIDDILALRVYDEQKGFVISTSESLAKAYVYSDTADRHLCWDCSMCGTDSELLISIQVWHPATKWLSIYMNPWDLKIPGLSNWEWRKCG